MGIFDFANNKDKKINNMLDEIKTEHENYQKEAKMINRNIDLKVRDYNDQIPIINTIRNNEFGPQIDKLYKFLKNFGDVGIEISPFDFITEKSRVNHHNDMDKSEGPIYDGDSAYTEFGRKVSAGMAKGAAYSSTSAIAGISTLGFVTAPISVTVPLVLVPVAIGGIIDGFMKNKANKDKIIELNKQLYESKLSYKNDIRARQGYLRTMKDAVKISEIYRVNIKSISRFIDDTILPELGLVKTFLIAEDAKNKIISGEEIVNLKPESITLYKDTPYHNHFLFVHNTFHLYKIIVEFFSRPILTTLLEDNLISQQEKNDFNKYIESININLMQLQENSIMSEVVFSESERNC